MANFQTQLSRFVRLVTRKQMRNWLLVWLPYIVLCLAPLLLTGRWLEARDFLLQVLPFVMLSFLVFKPSLLKTSGTTLLSTLILIAILVQLIAPYTWSNSQRHSFTSFLSSLKEDQVSYTYSSRTWQILDDTRTLELGFEAKLVSGTLGWQWAASSSGFKLEPVTEKGVTFTRVVTPLGFDPYLLRSYRLPQAVAGQTFKIEIDLRSPTLLAAEGCRGVWLQTWFEGGGASCLAVALTPKWQTFTHTWTAPGTATSHIIRVILNDFDGLTYDVGETTLYLRTSAGWQTLEPLLPATPALLSPWDNSEGDTGTSFVPSLQWQPYTFTFSKLEKSIPQQFSATLLVPSGVTLATRNVKLGVLATPFRANIRQSYIFGHPNLAGHTVVMVTLLALALTTTLPTQLFVAALGFVACYFTGSRSAWLVLILAIAAILWFKQRVKRKYLVGFYALSLLVLLALWPYLGRLQVTGVDNPSSRQDIWLTSLKIAGDHLGLGIGTLPEQFSELWYSYNPNAKESVKHAHNLVLEWLVDFGVLGGLAILWLLVGLVRLAWVHQGRIGVIIVLALITLNGADVSLFYAWVFVPFILYLNTQKE
jgi:hypothetical protein